MNPQTKEQILARELKLAGWNLNHIAVPVSLAMKDAMQVYSDLTNATLLAENEKLLAEQAKDIEELRAEISKIVAELNDKIDKQADDVYFGMNYTKGKNAGLRTAIHNLNTLTPKSNGSEK